MLDETFGLRLELTKGFLLEDTFGLRLLDTFGLRLLLTNGFLEDATAGFRLDGMFIPPFLSPNIVIYNTFYNFLSSFTVSSVGKDCRVGLRPSRNDDPSKAVLRIGKGIFVSLFPVACP